MSTDGASIEYQIHEDACFNFDEELLDYCRNDVHILSEACLTFRRLLIEIGKVDPFNYISIASTCMAVYKANFLEEEYEIITVAETVNAQREGRDPQPEIITVRGGLEKSASITSKSFIKSNLGITPSVGYTVRDNYSQQYIAWLEWLQHKDPSLNIQHALNGRGEY